MLHVTPYLSEKINGRVHCISLKGSTIENLWHWKWSVVSFSFAMSLVSWLLYHGGSRTSQSKKHTILKTGCKNESRTSKACLEALVISLKITLALVDGDGERECAATSHNFFSGYTTRRAICFRNKSLRHLCDRLFDALSKCHNMLGLNLAAHVSISVSCLSVPYQLPE